MPEVVIYSDSNAGAHGQDAAVEPQTENHNLQSVRESHASVEVKKYEGH